MTSGEEASSYSAFASITIERRTLPKGKQENVQHGPEHLLGNVKRKTPTF